MLLGFTAPYEDCSIFFTDMPEHYKNDMKAMFILSEDGLLSEEANVYMTWDVGWITQFGGFKVKTDQRNDGRFYVAGY